VNVEGHPESVHEWLTTATAAEVFALPPYQVTSRTVSCVSTKHSTLLLGADAALIGPGHGSRSSHTARHSCHSSRSSTTAEILNFTKGVTDNLLKVADQLRVNAVRRDELAEIREQHLVHDVACREEAAHAREQNLLKDAARRDELAYTGEKNLVQHAARREENLAKEARLCEQILAKEAAVAAVNHSWTLSCGDLCSAVTSLDVLELREGGWRMVSRNWATTISLSVLVAKISEA